METHPFELLKKYKVIFGFLLLIFLCVICFTIFLLVTAPNNKQKSTATSVITNTINPSLTNTISITANILGAYTALKPDPTNDNYVGFSNKCDLAIKYPKTYKNSTIYIGFLFIPKIPTMDELKIMYETKYKSFSDKQKPSFDTFYNNYFKDTNTVNTQTISEMEILSSISGVNIPTTISCHFENVSRDIIASDSLIKKYNMTKIESQKQLTATELQNLTQWYITQSDIQNIVQDIYKSESLDLNYNIITFEFNNKIYRIKYGNTSTKSATVPAVAIQLQFNSVVKNIANIEIKNKPTNFIECQQLGFPVQKSKPQKCVLPDGQIFSE